MLLNLENAKKHIFSTLCHTADILQYMSLYLHTILMTVSCTSTHLQVSVRSVVLILSSTCCSVIPAYVAPTGMRH